MTSTKPTIVFVPGAWHSPIAYEAFFSTLKQAGYAIVSAKLLSVNSPTPKTSTAAIDTSYIRDNMLLPLLDEGKDILLVCHSYGGIPGAAAAQGESKSERSAAGKSGGIIGIVNLSAIMVGEGGSVQEVGGGKLASWVDIDEESGLGTVHDPTAIFWADAAPDAAASAEAVLGTQALLSFRTPSSAPAWLDKVYDGRRAYIMCMEDQAIPPVVQQMMMQDSGVEWDVKELQSSHSPFLSMPEKVKDLVVGWAEEWTGKAGEL